MTDTVIKKSEECQDYSFQLIPQSPIIKNIYLLFIDPQFNIVWLERSLIDYIGAPLINFSGKCVFDLIPNLEIKSLFSENGNNDQSGNLQDVEFTISPFSKKTLQNCCLRITPYQNDRGMITGYFLIYLQI